MTRYPIMNTKPQLSYNYTPGQTLEGQWMMSQKYDGIRALWTGSELVTRSLRKFTWVPQWFLDKLPRGIPLDGEIVIPGKPFNRIAAITVQMECDEAHERWSQVVYKIFDSPHPTNTWSERIKSLRGVLKKPCELISFVNANEVSVQDYFREITSNGGEGIMLIRTNSKYQPKRTRDSLKYKKNHEGEATVVGLCEGRGKYKGFLGKLRCQLPNGKEFYCGTGFSDEQRKSYTFVDGIPLGVTDRVPQVGDTITYSCMEINPNGVPRMSVFKTIRTD